MARRLRRNVRFAAIRNRFSRSKTTNSNGAAYAARHPENDYRRSFGRSAVVVFPLSSLSERSYALESALRNPGTYYVKAANNDWTAPQNADLWRDGVKTLFDPCPAGWRVPRSGDEDSGRNPWQSFSDKNTFWEGSGRRWGTTLAALGTWYVAAGYREYGSGMFRSGGQNANYWSSSIRETVFAYNLHFTEFYFYADNRSAGQRSYGFSVRCLRE